MVQRSSWGATVGTAIALQWAVVLILSVFGWLWGFNAAQSVFAGGAAVALPNTALALWLTARVRRNGFAGAGAMMFGELLKLCLTLALLVMVVSALKPTLSWLAMIAGVVGALKAQWLALWVTRRY